MSSALPEQLVSFLNHPDLVALWRAVAARLEKNGLEPTGVVTIPLSAAASEKLSGLLAANITPGEAVRIRLAALDAAFRRSGAAIGLIPAIAALTGAELVDRQAVRQQRVDERSLMWAQIDVALAGAGLAAAAWVPAWQAGLRQSGILTRAGAQVATDQARYAIAVLGLLAHTSVPALRLEDPATAPGRDVSGALNDDLSSTLDSGTGASQVWELGQLAAEIIGDAHGLDDDRLASTLVLKALSAALGVPAAKDAAQRRALWVTAGVSPDAVSGTAIVWGLRPPGNDPWSTMMRSRADLGLVSHLTVHELTAISSQVEIAAADCRVWVCENPQVLQAAAHANSDATLICLLGNPSSAGALLIRRLLAQGVTPAYHGDFDWPGVAIAARMIASGCRPWRFGAPDYLSGMSSDTTRLPLSGARVPTPWDPELARAMATANVAVHEEALLAGLLNDLAGT